MMMGMGLIWLVLILLLVGGLVIGVVWIARASSGSDRMFTPRAPEQTPREILDQRYARGELSREEYERMKQDLDR